MPEVIQAYNGLDSKCWQINSILWMGNIEFLWGTEEGVIFIVLQKKCENRYLWEHSRSIEHFNRRNQKDTGWQYKISLKLLNLPS